MNKLIQKQFNNQLVTFDLSSDMMISLTDMAKANGKEVKYWLELSSTKSYLSKLSEVGKSEVTIVRGNHSDGRQQGTWGSRRVAIRFAQWLSDEFAIWVDTQIEELLTNGHVSLPQTYLQALEQLVTTEKERARLESLNTALMHTTKTYTTSELAKEFGFKSAQQLNKLLNQKGVQYKQNKTWLPYAKYSELGLVEIKQDTTESGHVYYQTRWTQSGRTFLIELLGL